MSNFISFITVYKSLFTDIRQQMILVCTNSLLIRGFNTFLVVLLLVRLWKNASTGENFLLKDRIAQQFIIEK